MSGARRGYNTPDTEPSSVLGGKKWGASRCDGENLGCMVEGIFEVVGCPIRSNEESTCPGSNKTEM